MCRSNHEMVQWGKPISINSQLLHRQSEVACQSTLCEQPENGVDNESMADKNKSISSKRYPMWPCSHVENIIDWNRGFRIYGRFNGLLICCNCVFLFLNRMS